MNTVKVHSQNKTYDASAGDTTYVMDAGVTISSKGGQVDFDASSGANNRVVTLAGSLSGANSGLVLGNTAQYVTGSAITVAKTGLVEASSNGIVAYMTEGKINVHGTVSGGMVGLAYLGTDGKVMNDGTIHSSYYATYFQGDDITFTNAGAVNGKHGGVTFNTQSGEHGTLQNTGSIISNQIAVFGGEGSEKIVNGGTITGVVQLNGGNDLYDGRQGTASDVVDGGTGRDRLIGGAQSDVLAGGADHDRLTGHGGRDLFVFKVSDGADTITDFKHQQHDQIELDGLSNAGTFADLAALMHQDGKDTVIDFGGGDVLTLHNVEADHLAKGDFFFG